ncbi:MAG TPA: hypothetical protein VFU43_07350 [Streptosporangiaceae bacterium]|nr:hypothetical protein [Streptosporangiaceae bacterium]
MYVADVGDALWTAWQLKGDPDSVLEAVDAWLVAAERLNSSEEHLSASRDDLKGLWSGPAFEAFDGYTSRNISAAEQNRDALIAAADHLIDIYTQVVQAYNEAVSNVVRTAAQLDSIIGVWAGNENENERDVVEKALVTLVTNIVTRDNTLRATLAGYRANLARIRAEQVKLKQPNDMPPAAKNRDRWERVG